LARVCEPLRRGYWKLFNVRYNAARNDKKNLRDLVTYNMKEKKHGRIDDIEALRAVAVVITIAGHIRFLFKWDNAHLIALDTYVSLWSGVDLFFAISGFVIARDLLARYDSSQTQEQFWRETFAFWTRRAFRIWPTAWFWASMIVAMSIIVGAKYWPATHTAFADLAAVMMHVVNVHLWTCANHVSDAVCGNTAVYWSLSLEEQFYLALPLVFLIVPRKLFVPLLFASVAFQFFIPRPVWSLGWVLRTDGLLLGVLIAIFERSSIYSLTLPAFMKKRRYSIPTLLALFFLLIEIPSNLAGKSDIVPFSTGLTAVVAAAIVLISSHDQDVIARPSLFKPVLMWVGSRSYGIYLIHAFCLSLTAQIWAWVEPAGTVFGPNYTLRYLVMFFGLTFGLAELNYRLIETPLRKRGRIIADKFARSSQARRPVKDQASTAEFSIH
jgi:peptidoglycan/LPS O-acetylase OafA/YrhL